MDAEMGERPAGWYDDPLHPGKYRRWDGTDWTEDVSDSDPDGPNVRQEENGIDLSSDTTKRLNAFVASLRAKPALLAAVLGAALVVAAVGWWLVFSVLLGGGALESDEDLAQLLQSDTIDCGQLDDGDMMCSWSGASFAAVYGEVFGGRVTITTLPLNLMAGSADEYEALLTEIGDTGGWWSASDVERMLSGEDGSSGDATWRTGTMGIEIEVTQ